MVPAKIRAPPTLSSSRFTLVTTACFNPNFATASATRRGSSRSIGPGLPLGTAQNPQRRVQISPSSIKVAVQHPLPAFQHLDSLDSTHPLAFALRLSRSHIVLGLCRPIDLSVLQ